MCSTSANVWRGTLQRLHEWIRLNRILALADDGTSISRACCSDGDTAISRAERCECVENMTGICNYELFCIFHGLANTRISCFEIETDLLEIMIPTVLRHTRKAFSA